MSIKSKKIVFAFRQPGNDQSLFFRLWNLMNLEGPLMRRDPLLDPEPAVDLRLAAVERELARFTEQMQRQQVHVDEIKRMCHVPV